MSEPRQSVRTSAGSILETVTCPGCGFALDVRADPISCAPCGRQFPRLGSIPVLFSEPDTYIAVVRRQLAELREQVDQTAIALEQQLHAADVLPLTKARCEALRGASRQQHSDIAALLEPLIPPATREAAEVRESVPSLLTNVHYLFRDWGWPAAPDDENERAVAALMRVIGDQPFGRALVLGAGACRLAYDLHRQGRGAETIALDIDPLLLAAARAVIRGGTVPMTEAYAELNELGRPATRWMLKAPEALSEDRFHFLLADGLNPPFAECTFDTVVTPSFIDAIPSDLRDAVAAVHRLLRPAGRWLSLGPLRYTPQVPITRRFAREEVFDLAERGGFRMGAWEAHSSPSLVSAHTGRGKVEWVMAFCAVKESVEVDEGGQQTAGPPAWLLFGHVPIPAFEGQGLLRSDDPLARLVISAIDGRRTLDDVTALVLSEIAQSGLSRRQVREAVRQCVADLHPAC